FSETRLSGVHDFRFGGTVKPLVELIPMSAAISGPLGKQWGYLFVENFGSDDSHYRTLSHELGHVSETRILGACEPKSVSRTNPDERSDIGSKTELEHTFAGDNTAHIVPMEETSNLMDYSDGIDLVRFQWEAIHNPAIIGKVFQSDEDGSMIDLRTLLGYVISDGNALVREQEDPYGFKNPKEILEKGRIVNLNSVIVTDKVVSISFKNESEKYYTSLSNISEVLRLDNKEKYLVVNSIESVSIPYSENKTGESHLRDSYVTADKICGDYYQVKTAVATIEGWWIHKDNLKRVGDDVSDNFDDLAKVSIVNGVVDSENLAKVLANRNSINDRTDSDIYSTNLRWVTKNGLSGYQYTGYDDSQPTITEGTDFEKYVIGIMLKELQKEGSYSSINAYDGEIFTWGKGFSVKGKLMNLIEALLNMPNKDYAQIFTNVGILIVDNHFWVLDESGNWKKDNPPSYEASNYIKTNTKLLSFFIELAQKEDYSVDVMTSQYNIVKDDGPLDFPSYILVNEKTAYADSWNDASVTVLCHLSHWLSACYGWHKSGNSYQDTKGDLAKVLYKYLYESVKGAKVLRKGEVIETNIYEWHLYYNVLDKFHEFGIPISIGETTLNETWNAHTLILILKNDTNGKLRAVCNVDGKQKYINNSESVLLEKDGKYLIVTNNANTIIYEDFK
ncbi:MAG: hypothetical protein JXB49_01255, partial [Bacteroidales bacterium]|nr:hypothetical protein [Bacteroidales bacterium]